jgi:nitric oxide synthase oxygenase domain/subunit
MTPLVKLMNEDVLGFEVESASADASGQGWSWEVKPATPALGHVFHHLVNNSQLKERFQHVEQCGESFARRESRELEQLQNVGGWI